MQLKKTVLFYMAHIVGFHNIENLRNTEKENIKISGVLSPGVTLLIFAYVCIFVEFKFKFCPVFL